MIIFIIGDQGSGKTTLAKKEIEYCKSNNLPEPYLIDDDPTLFNDDFNQINELVLRDRIGIKTIITIQSDHEIKPLSIPPWVHRYDLKLTIINLKQRS